MTAHAAMGARHAAPIAANRLAALIGPAAPALTAGLLLAGHLPQAAFLALAVAVGLPHGAFDHEVGRRAFVGRYGARWWRPFLAGYLALVVSTFAMWWAAPGLILSAFLLLSVVHFGEADAPAGPPYRLLRIAAHGGTVIVVPACIYPHVVTHLFDVLAPASALRIEALLAGPLLVLWAGAAAASCGLYLSSGRPDDRRAATDLMLVALLFALVPPLVAFSLYFAAIHAPRAFAALRPVSPGRGAALMPIVLTLLGLAMGGAIYLIGTGAGTTPGDGVVRAAFLLLSALTVPHMWLEWSARCATEARTGSAPSGRIRPTR